MEKTQRDPRYRGRDFLKERLRHLEFAKLFSALEEEFAVEKWEPEPNPELKPFLNEILDENAEVMIVLNDALPDNDAVLGKYEKWKEELARNMQNDNHGGIVSPLAIGSPFGPVSSSACYEELSH